MEFKTGDLVLATSHVVPNPDWHGVIGTVTFVTYDAIGVEANGVRFKFDPSVLKRTKFRPGDCVVCEEHFGLCAEVERAVGLFVSKIEYEDNLGELLLFSGKEHLEWFTASRFGLIRRFEETEVTKATEQTTEPSSPLPALDAYEQHRERLDARLLREGHSADVNLDLAVASAMCTDDTVSDPSDPNDLSHAARLALGLRSEWPQETYLPAMQHPLSTWSGRRGGRRERRL
jgi:hypothetical protein